MGGAKVGGTLLSGAVGVAGVVDGHWTVTGLAQGLAQLGVGAEGAGGGVVGVRLNVTVLVVLGVTFEGGAGGGVGGHWNVGVVS